MADKKVERVARAIAGRYDEEYDTVFVVDGYRFDWMEIARAAIEEAECWLPIESAPKDGAMFLCAVRGRAYTPQLCKWVEVPDGGRWFSMLNYPPTCWQHLPAPPKTK